MLCRCMVKSVHSFDIGGKHAVRSSSPRLLGSRASRQRFPILLKHTFVPFCVHMCAFEEKWTALKSLRVFTAIPEQNAASTTSFAFLVWIAWVIFVTPSPSGPLVGRPSKMLSCSDGLIFNQPKSGMHLSH